MTNPFKMQALIDKLQKENNRLRQENNRLRNAEAGTALTKFAKEKESALLFAMKAIEERTMSTVQSKLAPSFNIDPNSMIIRAFRDCLRLSMHFIDPRRAANLYNALTQVNPNADGSIPTIEQVSALLATPTESDTSKAVYIDAGKIPHGPARVLFICLRKLAADVEDPGKDTIPALQAAIQAAEVIRDHPAAVFTLELGEAVDNAAEDIGGSRPQRLILKDALDCFLEYGNV